MAATPTYQWEEMSDAAAVVALANESGRPVVWANDGVIAYARPLRDNETAGQAFREFAKAYEQTDHLTYDVVRPDAAV